MDVRSEYLAAALAALDDAVVMLDGARRIVALNPAAEQLLGCPAHDACGVSIDEHVQPLAHEPGPDDPDRLSLLLRGRDGTDRVLRGRSVPVHGADGALLGEVLVLRPERLVEAGGWQRLVRRSEHLSCIMSADACFQWVSARWTEVLGYAQEEMRGRHSSELIHPDDRERTHAEGRRMLEQRAEVIAFENRYRCKQGSYRWLAWYAIHDPGTGCIFAIASDITEIKRQERLLQETQVAVKAGGWEIDIATDTLYWTEETYRIHDTTPEEYTPTVESAIGFYADRSRDAVTQAVQRAIDAGEPFEFEVEIVTARGRRIWCRTIGQVAIEGGKVIRVYGSFQDITEQRRIQHALRDSEERFRSIVRDVGMGLVVHGPRAEIRQCNQAALDALGRTEDQLLGKTWLDEDWSFIHEDGAPFPGSEHPAARALATGKSVTGVVMGVYRPGPRDRVWLVVNAVVQHDPHGDVIGVLVSFLDITDRKRAEDAARDSLAMFHAVYDNAGLGVLLREPDGRLIECNRAFERMIGYPSEALPSMDRWVFVHPDDREDHAALLSALLAGDRESYELDRRYLRADGSVLWGHVTTSLVRNPDGSPRCQVEMVTDITDRKQMEAQLLLADRMASLGTMAAGVAHEINNPLTWLMGNVSFALDLLDEVSPDGAMAAETLDELRSVLAEGLSGAERVRTIVRDLKLFSRTEESPDATADLGRVIHTTTRMLHNEINHQATLVLEVESVPPVAGDEARFGQVLTNLLVNAVHALPQRSRHDNRIQVSLRRVGEHAVVEVRDNGVGIPPELQARIFDPFFTTKDVGEGTGLGLSICHSIVTSVGGHIEVNSKPGAGTTFRIWLRLLERREEVAGRLQMHARPEQRKRILCIDDEPDVGRLVERLLRKRHDVTVETDGMQALARIRAGEHYDAIICDLMMPSMSGMDFYRELFTIVPDLAERCGFVTGGVFTPAARAFAAELPPARLLEKPFRGDAIHALVDHLIG